MIITAKPFCIIDGYVVVQIYQSETVLACAIIMGYTIDVKHLLFANYNVHDYITPISTAASVYFKHRND